ncbi:hypothetical protein HanRHA438_Chr16g0788861 [Helianthus annuus]|nr:hypothetical protein HanRHA438_Chr16g0788861 [Helianthus annuus]
MSCTRFKCVRVRFIYFTRIKKYSLRSGTYRTRTGGFGGVWEDLRTRPVISRGTPFKKKPICIWYLFL